MMNKKIYAKTMQIFLVLIILVSAISLTKTRSTETTEPIIKNYSLPLQSWTFIHEENFTKNQVIRYIWESDLTVQGKEVTEEQYNIMLGLSLSERSLYFETIGYYNGILDSGKNNNGFQWGSFLCIF